MSAIRNLLRILSSSLLLPADRHHRHGDEAAFTKACGGGGAAGRVLGAGTCRLLGPPASHDGSRIDAGCLVGQVVFQIATTS